MLDRADPNLRFEDLYNSGELFPHLYRPIKASEIKAVIQIPERSAFRDDEAFENRLTNLMKESSA